MCRRLERGGRQLTAVVAGSLVDWLPEQGGLQLSRCVEVLLVTPLTKTSCFVTSQQEDFTLWRFYFKHSRTPTSDGGFVSTRVPLRATGGFL